MEYKVEKILLKIFLLVEIFIFGYFFLFSVLFSYQNTDFIWDYVYKIVEFVPLQIVSVLIYAIFVMGVVLLANKAKIRDTRPIALIVGFLCTIISIYWIFTCGSTPGSDAGTVVRVTTQFMEGDYSTFEAGDYIGMNRHQLGLITVLRVLFSIFGMGNYQSFRIMSALFVTLLVYSGYKNVSILSNKNRIAEYTYLLFVFLCVPIYMYTPFVYGEIISTALLMFIFWMIFEEIKQWSWIKLVLIFIATFLADMFRRNILITVIAIVGIMVVSAFTQKNSKYLLIVVAVVLACFLEQFSMNVMYDKYFPDNAKHTPPANLWIAMGLNDDGVMSGWWDRETIEIYNAANCDREVAAEMANEIIKERVTNLVSNPVHLVRFLLKKVSSQWIAPMFQCIAMNNVIDGSESKLAHAIYYDEEINYGLSWVMNIYQIFIYGTGFIWIIQKFRKPGILVEYFIPMAIFGGFLFSILWEGKSRYVFPYYLMIMVLSSVGASYIFTFIKRKLEKK